MNKPLSVIIEDAKRSLIEAVNGSGLPPVILEYLVRDIYVEVSKQADIQRSKEAEEFNNKEVEE